MTLCENWDNSVILQCLVHVTMGTSFCGILDGDFKQFLENLDCTQVSHYRMLLFTCALFCICVIMCAHVTYVLKLGALR